MTDQFLLLLSDLGDDIRDPVRCAPRIPEKLLPLFGSQRLSQAHDQLLVDGNLPQMAQRLEHHRAHPARHRQLLWRVRLFSGVDLGYKRPSLWKTRLSTPFRAPSRLICRNWCDNFVAKYWSCARREVLELRRQAEYWKAQHARAVHRAEHLEAEVDHLRGENRKLQDQLFGRKSEKSSTQDRSNRLSAHPDAWVALTAVEFPARGGTPRVPAAPSEEPRRLLAWWRDRPDSGSRPRSVAGTSIRFIKNLAACDDLAEKPIALP